MAIDTQRVIEFADALCKDARGNLMKMNRLAANQALAFYQTNVHHLGSVDRDTFVACYPQFIEEIEGIRLAAEKAQEAEIEYTQQGDRIATLEAKLDKLEAAIMRLTEELTTADTEEEDEPEAEEKPKRRARKTKAEPAEPAEGTTSEGEPEASEDES